MYTCIQHYCIQYYVCVSTICNDNEWTIFYNTVTCVYTHTHTHIHTHTHTSQVNKDSSSYPPNSVVVGMFEGYYSHPGVGGVPCPPKITHSLEKLLPPQSLLEVNKLEVRPLTSCVHNAGSFSQTLEYWELYSFTITNKQQ